MTLASENLEHLRSPITLQPKNQESDPCGNGKAARIVQIKTVEVVATVAPDGKVTLQLPPEITPGEHHITLLIQENSMPQTA